MYEIENLTFGCNTGDREIRDRIQLLRKEEQDTFIVDRTAKKADWDEIINLCETYLKDSKDLYILNRMCEAITVVYGIPGFRLSLEIISKFLDDAQEYFPLDEEIRQDYFRWINNRLLDYIYKNETIDKFLQKKQTIDLEESIETLEDCLSQAQKFPFYSEILEEKILKLAGILKKTALESETK